MRVRYNGRKAVVKLRHFRHTPKHIAILMQLQAETPDLYLEATRCEDGRDTRVRMADLLLDYDDLRFLNPLET